MDPEKTPSVQESLYNVLAVMMLLRCLVCFIMLALYSFSVPIILPCLSSAQPRWRSGHSPAGVAGVPVIKHLVCCTGEHLVLMAALIAVRSGLADGSDPDGEVHGMTQSNRIQVWSSSAFSNVLTVKV